MSCQASSTEQRLRSYDRITQLCGSQTGGGSQTFTTRVVEARESIETSDRVSNLGFAERFKRERWQIGETLRSIREILCDLKEKI